MWSLVADGMNSGSLHEVLRIFGVFLIVFFRFFTFFYYSAI